VTRRAHWTGRRRLIQWVTLLFGVTLFALVIWNVTRPSPPPPPTVAGSWVGVGSVYDSSSGGADRIAVFLSLRQSPDGQIAGPARECNDHAQTAAFTVTGQSAYPTVTLAFSGVTLRGHLALAGFIVAGSANGSSIQLNLRRGDQSAFTAACAALLPRAVASATLLAVHGSLPSLREPCSSREEHNRSTRFSVKQTMVACVTARAMVHCFHQPGVGGAT
jgi:hypothetical protein